MTDYSGQRVAEVESGTKMEELNLSGILHFLLSY